MKDQKPWLMIEAKLSQEETPAHHFNFSGKLGGIPILQLVHKDKVGKIARDGSWIVPLSFFQLLKKEF